MNKLYDFIIIIYNNPIHNVYVKHCKYVYYYYYYIILTNIDQPSLL